MIDHLKEMGIQRWRRRQLSAHDLQEPTAVSELAEESELEITNQDVSTTELELAPVIESQVDSWASVVESMQAETSCAACGASNPILGEGKQDADWLFLIDAPTSVDIKEQKLLSGRAGKLFDAILAAMDLQREEVYLTSVFKCAPSDDYKLNPSCSPLLDRQLKLIEPHKVVAFGEFTAQTFMRSNDPLERLRKDLHQSRQRQCTVAATHSLQDMLHNPSLKGLVWRDLRLLLGAD